MRSRRGNTAARQSGIIHDAPDRYLLIKAWGYGFWSDVSHVLAHLLLAGLAGRTPVIHWGSNSLFSKGGNEDAFTQYFEPVSVVSIDYLTAKAFDCYPSKWNRDNLRENDNQKWSGLGSRTPALYCLSRSERVVVSDFYSGVIDLVPWIPGGHPLRGKSITELYRYLVRKYLKPVRQVTEQVDKTYSEMLLNKNHISVHMRGSDKALELPNIERLNGRSRGASPT